MNLSISMFIHFLHCKCKIPTLQHFDHLCIFPQQIFCNVGMGNLKMPISLKVQQIISHNVHYPLSLGLFHNLSMKLPMQSHKFWITSPFLCKYFLLRQLRLQLTNHHFLFLLAEIPKNIVDGFFFNS